MLYNFLTGYDFNHFKSIELYYVYVNNISSSLYLRSVPQSKMLLSLFLSRQINDCSLSLQKDSVLVMLIVSNIIRQILCFLIITFLHFIDLIVAQAEIRSDLFYHFSFPGCDLPGSKSLVFIQSHKIVMNSLESQIVWGSFHTEKLDTVFVQNRLDYNFFVVHLVADAVFIFIKSH